MTTSYLSANIDNFVYISAPVPDIPLIPQLSALDDINSDSFVQRSFSSSASAPRASLPEIPLPVVVDLTEEPKHSASGDLGVMSPVVSTYLLPLERNNGLLFL